MMMNALTGKEILYIWEVGQGQHPLDRAMTMLRVAFPEAARDNLIQLTIGQRDSCLLAVREQTFGTRLSSLAICPECQEQVEFMLNTSEMHPSLVVEPDEQVKHLTVDGYEVHFRLPNSVDLAALVGNTDVAQARQLLLQRSVQQATKDGIAVKVEDLPEAIVEALAAHMGESDPMAEMELDLTCGACEHHWQVLFDIVSFFWTEIIIFAKQLLGEVHILAQAYGWREMDILSMSAFRRQFYLEMVTDG
jgi:hypothetical protein